MSEKEYVVTVYLTETGREELLEELRARRDSSQGGTSTPTCPQVINDLIEAVRDAPTEGDIAHTDWVNRELNDGVH